MIKFKPPINERSTSDLLNIVAVPKNWTIEAIDQAKTELDRRGTSIQEVEKISRQHKRKEQLEQHKRATESYSILEFVLHPLSTILEVIISWELKRDGYLRKAKQQKWLRLAFITIILLLMITTKI